MKLIKFVFLLKTGSYPFIKGLECSCVVEPNWIANELGHVVYFVLCGLPRFSVHPWQLRHLLFENFFYLICHLFCLNLLRIPGKLKWIKTKI